MVIGLEIQGILVVQILVHVFFIYYFLFFYYYYFVFFPSALFNSINKKNLLQIKMFQKEMIHHCVQFQ